MGCWPLLCVTGKLADRADNEVDVVKEGVESEPRESNG